jgi:glycosyltransferase involved in cell wall biosynthesis
LLHAHDYKTNLLGLLLGRCFKIPVVTTLHGYVSRGGRLELYYFADRLSLPLMDHVVSVSSDLDHHANSVRVPKVRRSLIENAIDTDDYRRRSGLKAAKVALGIPVERYSIGAIGRLSEEKGFDLLIRAAHELLQQGVNLELLIAGTGDAEPQLRTLIANLGLDNRVRLLGHLSDVRPFLEALDVFALSSHREGLPNVLLEAMALEVPVVATRVNGVPRLVIDGENGLLVEAGTVEGLTLGIRKLIEDIDLRSKLAAAGRRTVVERFSFCARMAKVRGVYDGLLGRVPRRRLRPMSEIQGDVKCYA